VKPAKWEGWTALDETSSRINKYKKEATMQNNGSQQARRSLGALRKAPKTKPRSPDAQGAMKVQRHTIETIMRQLEDSDADEVTANIAGWFNKDSSGRYITVELSPRYVSRHQVQREEPINTFDSFFQEKENFH
jgi:hypothetical protein